MPDDSIFQVMDPEFFTSLEERTPGAEFRAVVEDALAPGEWTLAPRGVWTHAHPAGWEQRPQGWKLHLSATPQNALEVLRKAAGVLARDPAAFKFASDRPILGLLLAKNWPREGGGKFITIYPADDEHFHRLGRALAEATEGLDGPYILSDRRVPGSRIVFYRYGEHLAEESVDPRGFRVHHMVGPAGERAQDRRRGYYQLPEWVEDPFGARPVQVLDGPEKEDAPRVTLNGRFEVHGVIKYSNMGGMYFGRDVQRDEPVIIRERRPAIGWIDAETDAVGLLHKEAGILREMDGTGWTPGFVDAFQAWEHHFVVMERVEGTMLRDYASARYFPRRRMGSPRRLFMEFRHLVLELVRGVEEFHRHGIILRDLTVANVLVRRDRSLCFIDFEYAWERHGAQAFAPKIHTPGFASPGQAAGHAPSEADDFYSLGAITVELCSMLAPGLGLNREGILAAAELAMAEIGLPRALLEVARGLSDPDPATRWRGDDVRRALAAVRPSSIPWAPAEPALHHPPEALVGRGVEEQAATAAGEVCRFLEAAAEPANNERLWPGSVEIYRINPVCIQYGACGPLELVRRVRGGCPSGWLDWVERRAVPGRCPPGLYVGMAGVALTLAACGRADAARRLLDEALAAAPGTGHASLYHGAAGVGVAALALADLLGDAGLVERAEEIGEQLERRAERRRHGIAWRSEEGVVPCGLAGGPAGVALFFTYLGARTGQRRYWETARKAMEFEFSQVAWRAGYAFWPLFGATRRLTLRSPHVSFGTAGVAIAAARLYACTGDPALLEWIDVCARTLSLRWTNKLWQDMGFAGWGETLLDLAAATGREVHRMHALRVTEALLPTRVRTRYGIAFPGGGLNRVASDFGMGASGIGLFLHRLAHGGHRAFFPDHLLPGFPASPPAVAAADDAAAAGPKRDRAASPRRRVRAPAGATA